MKTLLTGFGVIQNILVVEKSDKFEINYPEVEPRGILLIKYPSIKKSKADIFQ